MRNEAKWVDGTNALKSLVCEEFYVFEKVYAASFEDFEVVNRAFGLEYANDLARQSVYDKQILYCMAFLLAEVRFFLFF